MIFVGYLLWLCVCEWKCENFSAIRRNIVVVAFHSIDTCACGDLYLFFFFYWLQFYYLSRDQCQLDIIMYPCDLWTSIEHVFVFVILLRGRWCVVCSGYWFIGEERQFFFLIHKWIWSTWSRKKCGNFPKKNTEKKYAHRLLYLNSNCIKLWMPVLNYWCVVYLHNPCAPSLSIPSAENMILQQQQRRQQ